jgi:hypothetical protein
MAAMESEAQDSQRPGLTGWPERMSAAALFKRYKVGESKPRRNHDE